MRGLHLVLLAALLCSDRGLSLECFFCLGPKCSVISCGLGQNICYKVNILVTLLNGRKESVKQGGCATSCEEVSKVWEILSDPNPLQNPLGEVFRNRGILVRKFELQNESCCDKDLCNGVSPAGRSLWTLAGGLLLSLGPALLWAQL